MESKPLTRQQLKIIEASALIRTSPPPDENSITYMARPLVQATLPHSDPGDLPEWTRTNGTLTLAIRPGWMKDPKTETRRCIGYPYGTIPRLLMFWMVKEAISKGSRRLELGNSLATFMREIGLDPERGGPRSDALRLRDQAERLFQATISFDQTVTDGVKSGHSWLNMQVAPKGVLWFDHRKPNDPVLFGSWIEISEDFFKAICATPVPVNIHAIAAIKNSSMALDLYALATFIAYQATNTGSERFLSWEQLQRQLGSDYANTDDFRRSIKDTLRKIEQVYPGLHLGDRLGGLEILPSSTTAVPVRAARRASPVLPTSPEIPPAIPSPAKEKASPLPILSANVIELFRTRYPRLDVDTCKEDFDRWLATKTTKPTAYGRAFLGFAQKWAVGKG